MDMLANTLRGSTLLMEVVGMAWETRMGWAFLIFVLPASFQLPTLSFARIKAGLLLFHLEIIINRLASFLLGEHNWKTSRTQKLSVVKSSLHNTGYLSLIWLYQQNLSNPSSLHQEGKLGTWKILLCKRNLSKQCQWNVSRFLQKWRALWNILKINFSKLQLRYVDGYEVGLHGTKKPGGGIMRWGQCSQRETKGMETVGKWRY